MDRDLIEFTSELGVRGFRPREIHVYKSLRLPSVASLVFPLGKNCLRLDAGLQIYLNLNAAQRNLQRLRDAVLLENYRSAPSIIWLTVTSIMTYACEAARTIAVNVFVRRLLCQRPSATQKIAAYSWGSMLEVCQANIQAM